MGCGCDQRRSWIQAQAAKRGVNLTPGQATALWFGAWGLALGVTALVIYRHRRKEAGT